LAVCDNRAQEGADDDFRATSLETISEMVAAGIGCTLLPSMAVPHLTARQRLDVRPLKAAKAHRRIGLLWRPSFPRSEDLEVLGRFVQELLPECVEPIGTVHSRRVSRPERAGSVTKVPHGGHGGPTEHH
jgi:LysR family transcriptional regulator, hydrogen peroxide-inducible genes activator